MNGMRGGWSGMALWLFGLGLWLLGGTGWAEGAERRSLEEVEAANARRLEGAWVVVRPGEKERSGFTLSKDGQLARAGQVLNPKLEVTDDQGVSRTDVTEARISPPSPKGRWAFMSVCEPVRFDDPRCWFQFLIDLEKRVVKEFAWTKYPQSVPLYWHSGERYVLIPVSSAEEVWLVAVDIEKGAVVEHSFGSLVEEAARPFGCRSKEIRFAPDLERFVWRADGLAEIPVHYLCSPKDALKHLTVTIDPATGQLKRLAERSAEEPFSSAPQSGVGTSLSQVAAKPGFDCAKAVTPVEKMICGHGELAGLDGQLTALYKKMLSGAADVEAVKSGQRDWLRQVRNVCVDVGCLLAAYRGRIAVLEGGKVGGGMEVALYPATYVGGFTGKESLHLTADGRILEEGRETGRFRRDEASFWKEARYPILLVQGEGGNTSERHCMIQPDLLKLICNEGGTIYSEFTRQGPVPKVSLPVAKKCDDEQLYLDVMEEARKGVPWMELKGSAELSEDEKGVCRITLYYRLDGKEAHVRATYQKQTRPVRLEWIDTPKAPRNGLGR
ncbi:MAG: hypothetical protein HQL86_02795 [Magnetococcales bacterium]|nr:hypothetical protein [Magnetococcales bacterium]